MLTDHKPVHDNYSTFGSMKDVFVDHRENPSFNRTLKSFTDDLTAKHFHSTITVKTVEREVRLKLADVFRNNLKGKQAFDNIVDGLSKLSETEYVVYDRLLYCSLGDLSDIQLGPFCVEPMSRLLERLRNTYPRFVESTFDYLSHDAAEQLYVSTKVKAGDATSAVTIAKERFTTFVNAVTYLMNSHHNVLSVGQELVFPNATIQAVSEEEFEMRSGGKAYYELLFTAQVFGDAHAVWLWNNITKDGNRWTRRILKAVDWLGRARRDSEPERSFVQVVFGIEALLTFKESGVMVTPSLASMYSEAFALVLGNGYSDRLDLEKRVKDIYEVRSQIAHGKIATVTQDYVDETFDLVRQLLEVLTTKPEYTEIKSIDEFRRYLNHLKYDG